LEKCKEFFGQIKTTCYYQILDKYKQEKHKPKKKRKIINLSVMNLNPIVNNFVNSHQQLSVKTPAEAAEIKLPLGRNKLLDLIKYARRSRITKR
jgi:hypothetical protein